MKRTRCEVCGVPRAANRVRHHERSAWHRKIELIAKLLSANVPRFEIARMIDRPPSYITFYMKLSGRSNNGKIYKAAEQIEKVRA